MLFNSLQFALFFPIVTIGYFALPHRARWMWLLAASCYFYMAFVPVYIAILGFTIVVDYAAGIAIEGAMGQRRRLYLALSLVANIGTLALFKYANFLLANASAALAMVGWRSPIPNHWALLLPIGLSFHTFQAMSYTIEVYRGRQAAERHFGIYALYVMFYPQLVAGPIERPQQLLHQFREVHVYDRERAAWGLTLMTWGLLKKIVIADSLAAFVAPGYAHPGEASAGALVIATVCFAFQIYCDFSGYSDIALGCAEVMGFRLMRNFRNPYFSSSAAEFWKRWHISLSSWFRDYVFLPFGYTLFRRVKRPRAFGIAREVWIYALASVVTMGLSGLWHGAAWTFVAWGLVHGAYLAAGHLFRGRTLKPLVSRGAVLWRAAFTFTLVSLAWVFFRAASVHDAATILVRMATAWTAPGAGGWRAWLMVPDPLLLAAVIAVLMAVMWIEWRDEQQGIREWLAAASQPARLAVYCTLGLLILLFARGDQQAPFIYFQF